MIRRFLAWSLVLLLITSAEARELTPLEQARKIAGGARVVVTLKDKRILTGSLSEIGPDRLTLERSLQGDWSGEVLLQDVEKIRENKPRLSIKEILLAPVWVVWWLGYLLWHG